MNFPAKGNGHHLISGGYVSFSELIDTDSETLPCGGLWYFLGSWDFPISDSNGRRCQVDLIVLTERSMCRFLQGFNEGFSKFNKNVF